jgi:hypothetical protein
MGHKMGLDWYKNQKIVCIKQVKIVNNDIIDKPMVGEIYTIKSVLEYQFLFGKYLFIELYEIDRYCWRQDFFKPVEYNQLNELKKLLEPLNNIKKYQVVEKDGILEKVGR